jgi:DNA topoisomerase-1
VEYVLTEGNIRATIKEKTFGEEKKKLVIQPVGTMTVEFLIQYFDQLFSYDYTKQMESELDVICNGDTNWYDLCEKCANELAQWMKPVAKMKKEVFRVMEDGAESEYVVAIGQYGPVLKREREDGKAEYRPVKRGISLDMGKLKGGQYQLEELMDTHINKDLGEYEGFSLTVKEGRYGAYVQWGDKKANAPDRAATRQPSGLRPGAVKPFPRIANLSQVAKGTSMRCETLPGRVRIACALLQDKSARRDPIV